MEEKIQKLFGEEALSYTEFMRRAEESGMRVGDLTETEAAHQKELRNVYIAHELERGLEKFGAKNGALVKKAMDMDAVRVENGKVSGVNEQLEALFASDPYLFREREPVHTGAEHGSSAKDTDSMTDAEFYRLKIKSE